MATIAEAELRINPILNVQEFNKLLKTVKGAMGDFGGSIQLIDPDELKTQIDDVEDAFDKLKDAANDAFDGTEAQGFRKHLGNIKDGMLEITGLKSEGGTEGLFNLSAAERFSGALSGAAEKARENQEAMRLLAAQTGATGDELARLETIAANVFQKGGFEDFSQAISAIGAAKKAFGDALDDAGLEAFTSGAAGIGKVLDVEVNEVISKSAGFVTQFGLDGQSAYELVALGAQKAGTASDDYLDSLAEYSGLAREAGLSAEEFIGILVAGGEKASFSTDKIVDAVKETGIRLNAGDIKFDEIEGLDAELRNVLQSGLSAATAGDLSVSDFMTQSVKAIDAAGLTDAMEAKLFAAISGTPSEDLGADLYADIFGADIDTAGIQAQAAAAGQQIGEAIAPQTMFEQLTLMFESSFGQLAGFLGPALGPASQFLQLTTQLGPAAQALKLGAMAKDAAQFGLSILSKVIPGLVTQTVATGAQAAATGGATVAQYALNTAMLANPAFLMVAGIGAVIGAFALFSGGGEDVSEALEGVNEAMSETEKVMADTAASDKQAENLRNLAGEYEQFKDSSIAEDQKKAADASRELAAAVPEARDNMEALNSEVERGTDVLTINTDAVLAHADGMNEMNKVAREGALAKLRSEMGDLVDATAEAEEEVTALSQEQQEWLDKAEGYDKEGWTEAAERYRQKAREISIEAGEAATEYNKGNAELQKGVKFLVDQGVSTKELAREWGVTEEEVKQMVQREEEAAKAAAEAADETGRIGDAASAAKGEVASLGDQFDAMLQNTQNAVKSAQSELAAVLAVQQTAVGKSVNNSLSALSGGLISLDKVKEGAIEQGRSAKKTADGFAAINKQAGLLIGTETRRTTTAKKTTKEKATEFELAQKSFDQGQKIFQMQERKVLLDAESLRLAEGREKTVLDELGTESVKLAKLKEQQALLRDILKVADGADLTVDNIGIKIKDGEKFAARELISNLQASIQEQENRLEEVKLSAGIELDESAVLSLQEQELQMQISLGLKEDSSLSAFLLADVTRLETALAEFSAEERAKYDDLYKAKVLSEDEYHQLVAQLDAGTHQRQLELSNTILQRRQQLRDRELALTMKKLDREFEAETATLEAIADETLRIRERIAESIQGIEDARITSDQDEALARLEDRYEKELITTERYEEEKTKLEEQAERRRQALAARLRGDALEAEREAELEALELQRDQLARKRDALLEAGNLEEAATIGEQVEAIGADIADKAGALSGLFDDLQGELGNAAVTLFDFDSEKAKEPWRNMFGIIGGGLERLAKAKATEVVLGLISGVGGIPGLILSFAAKPIVEALISRFASPILDSLLSFPTGGVIDQPTLFIAGDGSRLGGENKEWIFRNDQLHDVIGMVVSEMQAGLVDELRMLREEIGELQFRLYVRGEDLTSATRRYAKRQQKRIINKTAYREAA